MYTYNLKNHFYYGII